MYHCRQFQLSHYR